MGDGNSAKKVSGISDQAGKIDRLLERDQQRVKDGFPKKIRVGRMVRHMPGGSSKTIIVPVASEEKLIHNPNFSNDKKQLGGSGEEKEGEVVGEESLHDIGSQAGPGGEGKSSEHEMEELARQLSQIMVEELGLPNLQNKGMRPALNRYIYDLTDRHVGSGQFLDKPATLKNIVKTNFNLGNIDLSDINPAEFIISPRDKVYRVVSREKEYESQAIVFFLRDYSGSMQGAATEMVCNFHFLFYSWLLSQYHDRIAKRYILHDTEAKEVFDFYTYANSKVAGGTVVGEAYKLVNKIVQDENLAAEYNIYVFHGTDGDDWDDKGEKTIPHIAETLSFVNRLGITIVHPPGQAKKEDVFSSYLKAAGLLSKNSRTLRVDRISAAASDSEMIASMKKLVSED